MQPTCQVNTVMISIFSFLEQAKCVYITFRHKYVNTCDEICNVVIVLFYQVLLNSVRRVPNYIRVRWRQACIKENPELFSEIAADMSVIRDMAHNVIKEVTELHV